MGGQREGGEEGREKERESRVEGDRSEKGGNGQRENLGDDGRQPPRARRVPEEVGEMKQTMGTKGAKWTKGSYGDESD